MGTRLFYFVLLGVTLIYSFIAVISPLVIPHCDIPVETKQHRIGATDSQRSPDFSFSASISVLYLIMAQVSSLPTRLDLKSSDQITVSDQITRSDQVKGISSLAVLNRKNKGIRINIHFAG